MTAVRACVVAVLGALWLSGCGLTDIGGGDVFSLKYVSLTAAKDMNTGYPVAVDLVIIYDPALTDQLAGLTAADWFRRKRQFKRDFPDGFKTMSWEMVPDAAVPPTKIDDSMLENSDGDDAVAGYVFADYFTGGEHRAKLEIQTGLRIVLERTDFNLESFRPDN